MLYTFLKGIALGLVVSITIGPAFFAIIQTGINRGFRSGILLASGILLSDLVLILLCYMGATAIMSNNLGNNDAGVNIYIGIIGGVILIIFGTVTFIKKPDILKRRSPTYKTPVKLPGPFTYIFKGFFLNIMNPFLIFFWFAAMNWVTANAEEGMVLKYAITFFSGTLITIFSIDLLKSYIGVKIKKYLKLRVILWVNRIVGIILIIFGIGLIFTSITSFL